MSAVTIRTVPPPTNRPPSTATVRRIDGPTAAHGVLDRSNCFGRADGRFHEPSQPRTASWPVRASSAWRSRRGAPGRLLRQDRVQQQRAAAADEMTVVRHGEDAERCLNRSDRGGRRDDWQTAGGRFEQLHPDATTYRDRRDQRAAGRQNGIDVADQPEVIHPGGQGAWRGRASARPARARHREHRRRSAARAGASCPRPRHSVPTCGCRGGRDAVQTRRHQQAQSAAG